MKHIFHFSCLIAAVLLLQACQRNPDDVNTLQTSPVGFTSGTQPRNNYRLLFSSSPQSITGLLNLKVQSGTAATAISVKLADSTAYLVNRYNTANGTSILPLPADRWTMPAEIVIPQGGGSAAGTITVNNTSGLDYNKLYAIGITISNRDGYAVPDSSRNLFIVCRIANILEGRYTMKGRYYSPVSEPVFAPHEFAVELHTNGPISVILYWPFAGMYTSPVTNGGVPFCCLASNTTTVSTVTSSHLVAVGNGDFAGPAYTPLSTHDGITYTNYYDSTRKTIYTAFGSSLGAGGLLVPGASRVWIDTLTYLGPL